MKQGSRRRWAFAGGAAALVVLALVAYRRGADDGPAAFIGSNACGSCHADQYRAWGPSQHSRAMQVAAPGTVLGNFDSATFTYGDIASTFNRRDGKFWTRTDGANGALQDFEIKYTFGVYPLQQYLVELSGGRLQALPVAWDARPKADGGQRWFHLYPTEKITAGDELHWTGRNQNWNFMCADCHSTNLRKEYDAQGDRYATKWSEMSVGCEACHGPGSRHASWARASSWIRRLTWTDNGLSNGLTERRGVTWTIDPRTGTATRSAPRTTNAEITACAQCHSRRQQVAEGYQAGAPLEDHYIPALITSGLYHPDGQQRDEVYTHGSFLQSRMAHAGVTCADCHEPHGGKLRAPGNGLCAGCHQAQKYDAPSHHFHQAGGAGSSCVSCHMPTTTYMVVDRRRDHSIRVPRPDRTMTLGVPNACNECHADRGAAWAADIIRGWYGRNPGGMQTFAEIFHADDAGRDIGDALAKLVGDLAQPPIVRASALARLGRTPGPTALMTAQTFLGDPDPSIRYAAASVFEAFAPEDRAAVRPLLSDPRRALRIEAAWLLAPVATSLPGADAAAFERAAEDFVASRELRSDRPEDRMTLGIFLEQRGRGEAALESYRSAVRLAPDYAPAHHTLGLALVRLGSKEDALGELKLAAELSNDAAGTRFRHDYAVALHSFGRVDEAIAALESAREHAPSDRDVLFALTTFHRDAGHLNDAVKYATELQRFYPADPDAAALLQSLRRPQSR